MPSFDVVSKIALNEVDNAIDGIRRETQQRFDLKGSMCAVERDNSNLTITADDDMKLKQMHELVHTYFARRSVDSRALEFKNPESATKGSLRQQVTIQQGLSSDLARSIIKSITGTKLRVQVAIQGEELRVSGKKRDDLQDAIAFIKDLDISQPLQYINFRD